jgi:hypothetical protein
VGVGFWSFKGRCSLDEYEGRNFFFEGNEGGSVKWYYYLYGCLSRLWLCLGGWGLVLVGEGYVIMCG